ncbi:hypothetical protein [Endothiovibrio diazotrophicus]
METNRPTWGRFPPQLDELVTELNRRIDGGATLWAYGSARLGMRALELANPPGPVVKVGLNAAINGIPALDVALAVDYSALRAIGPHTRQPGMTFLFPRHPEVLCPGCKEGRPLPAFDAQHPLPPTAEEAARREGWRVRRFDYRRLGNPGGGSYYYSVKPHPLGFFTYHDAAGRPMVINGFARLDDDQREGAAYRIALRLDRDRHARHQTLNGLLAGRSLFPLMDLLLRTNAEEIHMTGFSDENPDYRMTNLVARHWAELRGKRLRFHLPDVDGEHRITGGGFRALPAPPAPLKPATAAPAAADTSAAALPSAPAVPAAEMEETSPLHLVIPYFDSGEPALAVAATTPPQVVTTVGYSLSAGAADPIANPISTATRLASSAESAAIRAANLRRTLLSIDRAARRSSQRVAVLLVEVTADGASPAPLPAGLDLPVERLTLRGDGNRRFPKQFLFACALEWLRRRHGGAAAALLHDADVPVTDPAFFRRVVNGLGEKRFVHGVTKGIYLDPALNGAVLGELLDGEGRCSPAILDGLLDGLFSNRLSNEVSRNLFTASRRLRSTARGAAWRLPPGDRVAVEYLRRLQRHYHAPQQVNFHFPGLSWAGRVGDLLEAIWPSALFTGWGFEDSTLMECARKLWGDGERADGVGCIVGPSGLLSHRGIPLGDALHQYHPVLPGLPWRRPGEGDAHRDRLFAFELKKAVQLRVAESTRYDAHWISWLSWMARAGRGGRLVAQALEARVLPAFNMVEELAQLFHFHRPGEPGAVDLDALVAYYDYWRRRGQPWRLYDRPGGGHGREGSLFSEDPSFRRWAAERGIHPADLLLTIAPRLSTGAGRARAA